jgi:hypothetical protein
MKTIVLQVSYLQEYCGLFLISMDTKNLTLNNAKDTSNQRQSNV